MRSTTLLRSTILAILLGSVLFILHPTTANTKGESPTVQTNDYDDAILRNNKNLRGNHRQTSTRIIGGTATPPNQFRYFTSLRRARSNSHYCGGSLISPTLVLSAAHCRSSSSSSGLFGVAVIGQSDFTNVNEGESIQVVEEIIHPNYGNVIFNDGGQGAAPNYDFMLLRLQRPVSLPNVQYVRLHNANDDDDSIVNNVNLEEGQDVTVIGHGYTSTASTVISNQLMEVQLTTISNEQCRQGPVVVPNSPWTRYDSLITDQMICAEGSTKNKDSCQGDSGGPLVVRGE
eukprot:CAMPEP_0201723942 /NCGR_PEP_ID=MMETSP0593-20130828/7820_1 /ASSEMBLY_ACC=CAM_ASM_000672 /TAXON_ID=267983 /ORGANISM="Skeletonema japonicum, Strain CCMP2506" /LENGTH=287 /DNA_ID=CAMNT_0048215111 /DNA_START=51 /DNA_END=911 /DNA_ORIENTATION=+